MIHINKLFKFKERYYWNHKAGKFKQLCNMCKKYDWDDDM